MCQSDWPFHIFKFPVSFLPSSPFPLNHFLQPSWGLPMRFFAYAPLLLAFSGCCVAPYGPAYQSGFIPNSYGYQQPCYQCPEGEKLVSKTSSGGVRELVCVPYTTTSFRGGVPKVGTIKLTELQPDPTGINPGLLVETIKTALGKMEMSVSVDERVDITIRQNTITLFTKPRPENAGSSFSVFEKIVATIQNSDESVQFEITPYRRYNTSQGSTEATPAQNAATEFYNQLKEALSPASLI